MGQERTGGAEDADDQDGVLVDEVDHLLGIVDVAVLLAVPVLFLDLHVARSLSSRQPKSLRPGRETDLFPADLHRRVHHYVRLVGALAGGASRIGPATLGREDGEDDGL